MSAFKAAKFDLPLESANRAVNVVFVAKICPELQAQLSLSQPSVAPKRRLSTLRVVKSQPVKKRRVTFPPVEKSHVPAIGNNF